MISLILAIGFIILFIILCIIGGNYFLKGILEKMVGNNTENFDNNNNNDINNINNIDECKKIDLQNQDQLNTQTACNIPLSPTNYKNYIGSIYIHKEPDVFPTDGLGEGKYCLTKPKLLYDGIWDPKINIEGPYEHETWKLTNGNLFGGEYCSDKLIEVNKPIPKNYIDKSASYLNDSDSASYYTFFNDIESDILDTQITCFPEVFNPNDPKNIQNCQ
jgi:hypothetical protein